MTENEYKEESERLRPALEALAGRYVHDPDAARDVVQDVLLKMWVARATLTLPVDAYARVLTRNASLDAVRRRSPEVSADVAVCDVSEPVSDTEDSIRQMHTIIAQLPPAWQKVLRMRHIYGMEYDEIALITSSTEAAVRKTVSRARKAVRDLWTDNQ